MSKKKECAEYLECFYCSATIFKSRAEWDHFPIPKECGGTQTVPCCKTCHDAKDRINADLWSIAWTEQLWADFIKFSPQTKLFIAKLMRLAAMGAWKMKERPVPPDKRADG